jgi:peptidoglycan/LPS O-acetylase OafA/YrhL
VQIFFVLSGYLITDLLIAEYHRHQGIGLRMFWIRRARRLLPALFLMLFVTVGWATLFDRSQLTALRSDLPAGIFYVSNWWFIFHHVSYFASFGPPSPLGHLWSLSIEEQFYFIWPLLLLVGMRYIHSKRVMILVTLTVAAASAAEMTILFVPGGNPTRVYDGTDTRAFALLIGAALAMALPRYQAFAPVTAGARRLLDVVGGASLVGIVAMIVATNEYETFLYRGGMLLLALLAALLIGVTIHPASHLRAVLGWEPLRWVGERSYGIYLWHYPVIVLTTPLGASPNILRAAAQIAATFGLAILSWNYVEQPVRHGALGRQWERLKARDWSWPRLKPVGWLCVGAAVANAVFCCLGLFGVISASAADPASQIKSIVRVPRRVETPPAAPGTSTLPPPAGQGVTAIGDSIMVDAAPYLQQSLPGIALDAQIGQQLYQVQNQVAQLKAEGAVGNRLILELGANGPYSTAQLSSLLDALGPMQRTVLVNARVPLPWQAEVNQTIATVAASRPNTVLVDWYDDSAPYPQYFYPDGVHLDPAGAKYYSSLLVQALNERLPRLRH